jgi:membrane-associated phospholipid phosphatase
MARTPLWIELGWLVFLIWIYNWLQDLAPLRQGQARANARSLLSFERSLGIDPEASLDHWLAHQQALGFVVSNFYAIAIFAITFAFAAWTWWHRPDIYVTLRNYIVLANLLAFGVFWAFPVAPPRMLPGFVDVVAKSGALGWHNTLVRHADQLAAMPSMHVGYAAWRLARSQQTRVKALVFGIGYPLLTAWAVMATGNHYLLDVVAGAATTGVAVLMVDAYPRLWQYMVAIWDTSPCPTWARSLCTAARSRLGAAKASATRSAGRVADLDPAPAGPGKASSSASSPNGFASPTLSKAPRRPSAGTDLSSERAEGFG